MTNNEVKPAFSLRYFLLTLITTLIVSGVGFLLVKYFDGKPVKELIVYDAEIINLIDGESIPEDQIEAKYFLKQKDGANKRIESLFKTKTFITNNSGEGIENLMISISISDKDATLIENPKISTEPKDIINAIEIKKNKAISNNIKHVWNISLLNQGESIAFDYSIYSEKKIEEIDFLAVPRKKDWKVTRKNLSPQQTIEEFNLSNTAKSLGLIIISTVIAILMAALPFYGIAWLQTPDYRKYYGSFSKFYSVHPPGSIFESKDSRIARFGRVTNKSNNERVSEDEPSA